MKSIISFLSFSIGLFVVVVVVAISASQYCATISASGTSGFYALQIENGVAQHFFNLSASTSSNSNTCQFSNKVGLTYHIHQSWNSATSDSSVGSTSCGASNTGGHYDPYWGCSSASQYSSSFCLNSSRVSSLGYTYTCNSSIFSSGQYSNCEVGDISGKFGTAYGSGNGDLKLFTSNHSRILVDNYPPLESNFNTNLKNSKMWSSIVFHCSSNSARLFCAKFSTISLTSCQEAFDKMNFVASSPTAISSFSSNSNPYSSEQYAGAVATSVLVCLFGGFAIGLVVYRFFLVPKQSKDHQYSLNLLSRINNL